MASSKPATNGDCSTATTTADTYLRTIVPISALYAGTLWLGNAAYLHLSVSFLQMLKETWGADFLYLYFFVHCGRCVMCHDAAASTPLLMRCP